MMVTKRSLHGNAIGRFRHKERDLDQDDAEPENNKRMRLEESSQVGPRPGGTYENNNT